jgi:hypothetical protein
MVSLGGQFPNYCLKKGADSGGAAVAYLVFEHF